MKLKKIASLALAGIMAVSMLAGCGEGNGNSGSSSSENTNTATGYSAVLESYMPEAVQDMDYVTFQDNASDAVALQNAVNNVSQTEIYSMLQNQGFTVDNIQNWSTGGHPEMLDALADAYELKDDDFNTNLSFDDTWIEGTNANRSLKDAAIFAANGSIGMNEVLSQIADILGNDLTRLPDESDAAVGTWNYNYVISVSVVNKPLTSYTTYTGSANYIAVTVTRTATQG